MSRAVTEPVQLVALADRAADRDLDLVELGRELLRLERVLAARDSATRFSCSIRDTFSAVAPTAEAARDEVVAREAGANLHELARSCRRSRTVLL